MTKKKRPRERKRDGEKKELERVNSRETKLFKQLINGKHLVKLGGMLHGI